MKIFIINNPITEGIMYSISKQDCISPGDIEIVEGFFDKEIPVRTRIAMSKEKCRNLAIEQGVDFAVIHDDDLLHLSDTNFSKMKSFLENAPEFGAVTLSRNVISKDTPIVYDDINRTHVCSGVIMVRGSALEDLSFGNSNSKPTCIAVAMSLNATGWKYSYLDRVTRIKHM